MGGVGCCAATIRRSDEEAVRGCDEVAVLRQVVRREGRTAKQFRDKFCPVVVGRRFEFVQQLLSGLRHGIEG